MAIERFPCGNLLTRHLLQCEAAKQEVLSLVSQTLVRNFPDRFQLTKTTLQNIATGEDFDLADQDRNPMDVVARLVQVRTLYDYIGPLYPEFQIELLRV